MKLRTALTPAEVAAECGTSSDILAAMADAEQNHIAHVRGMVIMHDGYQSGAELCHAGTSLYRILR